MSGATGYDWRWSTDQSMWTAVSSTTEASTPLTGLPSDTLVYVQVRAANSAGTSAWSASASLATLAGQAALARSFDGVDDVIDWGAFTAMGNVSALSISACV
ncbi:MAG: hypothetical protein ACREIA_12140 [Opitutaceae bacterium]